MALLSSLVGVATLLHSTNAAITVIESGSSGRKWLPLPNQTWTAGPAPPGITVAIHTSQPQQQIMGFGSCFTDTSAYNAMVFMNATVRAEFLEALWGASGLGFSVMRVHINSPDYAFQTYNFDNVTDDFALGHFDRNLSYDQQRVVPLIRAAHAVAAGWTTDPIKMFGSPWSPPGWMKQNGNMINSNAVCLKEDVPAGSYKASVLYRG